MHVETRYFFSFKNISRTTKNKKKDLGTYF